MSDFVKTDDMAAALPATNGTGPVKDKEAYDRARAQGWAAPEPTSYPADNVADSQPMDGEFVDNPMEQWMHSAEKYEWKEEYGDVGPEIPELEAQLFNKNHKPQKGNLFEK